MVAQVAAQSRGPRSTHQASVSFKCFEREVDIISHISYLAPFSEVLTDSVGRACTPSTVQYWAQHPGHILVLVTT